MTHRRRQLWGAWAVVIVFLLFSLLPIYWVLLTAFRGNQAIFHQPVLLAPTDLSLENIQYVLFGGTTNDPIIRFFFTSLVIASITTVVATSVGVMAAYAIVRYRTGGNGVRDWFVTQRFLPAIALILPLFVIYKNLGLLDTHLGLLSLHIAFAIPIAVWLMLGHVRSLAPDFEEAAFVEGASRWSAFGRIVVPLLRNGIAITAMFTFIASWNEYLFAYQLAGNDVATITVYIPRLRSAIALLYGQVAAASLLSLVPALVFAWVLQRFLVHGLTTGGVND